MPMSTCQYQTHMVIQQIIKDSLSVNILTLTQLYTINQRPHPPPPPPSPLPTYGHILFIVLYRFVIEYTIFISIVFYYLMCVYVL